MYNNLRWTKMPQNLQMTFKSWSKTTVKPKGPLTLQDSRKLWLEKSSKRDLKPLWRFFLKVCQILVKWRGTNQIFTLRKKGFENWLPTHFYAQLAAKKPINHVVWSIHNFQVFYCNLTSWFVIIKLWHRFSFGLHLDFQPFIFMVLSVETPTLCFFFFIEP